MDPISENTNEDVLENIPELDENDIQQHMPMFEDMSTEDDNIENKIFEHNDDINNDDINNNDSNDSNGDNQEQGMLSGLFNFSNVGSEISSFLENNLLIVVAGLISILVLLGILYKDLFFEIFPFVKTIFEQNNNNSEYASEVENSKET